MLRKNCLFGMNIAGKTVLSYIIQRDQMRKYQISWRSDRLVLVMKYTIKVNIQFFIILKHIYLYIINYLSSSRHFAFSGSDIFVLYPSPDRSTAKRLNTSSQFLFRRFLDIAVFLVCAESFSNYFTCSKYHF